MCVKYCWCSTIASSFIISRPNCAPTYLSMYLCPHFCFGRFWPQRCNALTPGLAYLKVAYEIYFSAHCAGVTNMSPRYNLFPLWRFILHMKCSAAPAKRISACRSFLKKNLRALNLAYVITNLANNSSCLYLPFRSHILHMIHSNLKYLSWYHTTLNIYCIQNC